MVEAKLKVYLEELLKFTLESHIKGTLEIDLGLPSDFCSNLLLNHPKFDTDSTSQREPPNPQYKQLALSLYEFIILGTHSSQWVNILNSINFRLHVQEPFFTQIKDGLKTIEGRCKGGHYNLIGSGDLIIFNNCLIVEVKDVRSYASFYEMLKVESLEKVLPGVEIIEEGVQIYRRFYSEDQERSNGVIAICIHCIEKLAAQPYVYLAKLLSELGFEGVKRLLELNST